MRRPSLWNAQASFAAAAGSGILLIVLAGPATARFAESFRTIGMPLGLVTRVAFHSAMRLAVGAIGLGTFAWACARSLRARPDDQRAIPLQSVLLMIGGSGAIVFFYVAAFVLPSVQPF